MDSMPRNLRLNASLGGSEEKSKSPLATSRLHHRSRGTFMEKDESITRPGSSRQNSFADSASNSSLNAIYPPQNGQPRDIDDYGTDDAKKTAVGNALEVPKIFGFPLKYVSLVTLALQNTALVLIMHYSRVSISSNNKVYSAASAVLLVEVLKCAISLVIAFMRTEVPPSATRGYHFLPETPSSSSPSTQRQPAYPISQPVFLLRIRSLISEIGSPDAWKLSIPALLYVLQNNLQYIALSNLDVPTFQVTNQMKILTTAGCSVMLLHRKLSKRKWISLALLALGVGIVQIQTSTEASAVVEVPSIKPSSSGAYVEGGDTTDPSLPTPLHPLTGFLAVTAACFTSGLAGVYFEMVLKGSTADLWVRNVQMSSWSIIPALIPVLIGFLRDGTTFGDMFANFGGWAWCTVLMQTFGGLITAIVIKYSDNILKGFATSLSIVLSFLASVALFNLPITLSFLVGASVVLGATWMYNLSDEQKKSQENFQETSSLHDAGHKWIPTNGDEAQSDAKLRGNDNENGGRPLSVDFKDMGAALISPIESHEPLLGYPDYPNGAGSSSSIGDLINRDDVSMSERLMERVSNMVGFTNSDSSRRMTAGVRLGPTGQDSTHAS